MQQPVVCGTYTSNVSRHKAAGSVADADINGTSRGVLYIFQPVCLQPIDIYRVNLFLRRADLKLETRNTHTLTHTFSCSWPSASLSYGAMRCEFLAHKSAGVAIEPETVEALYWPHKNRCRGMFLSRVPVARLYRTRAHTHSHT